LGDASANRFGIRSSLLSRRRSESSGTYPGMTCRL